ncbi:tolB domain protein, partial [Chlamydia psittaci C1/97]
EKGSAFTRESVYASFFS